MLILRRLISAAADGLAELVALEEQAATRALGRDHTRAGKECLEQRRPENGIRNHELRGHTCDIDATREI